MAAVALVGKINLPNAFLLPKPGAGFIWRGLGFPVFQAGTVGDAIADEYNVEIFFCSIGFGLCNAQRRNN